MSGHTTFCEINLDNIAFNYETVCRYVAPSEVIPVLKGNAYGHGAVALARVLVEMGCRHLTVAKLTEASQLRKAGIDTSKVDLIIMTAMLPDEIDMAISINASFFVPDFRTLDYLRKVGNRQAWPPRFHIKVDTGMGRMGFMPEEGHAVAMALKSLKGCKLEGFATHLCAAGEDSEQNQRQLERFDAFLAGVNPPDGCLIHMASSSAVCRFPEMFKSAVRVGDLIYGLCGVDNPPFELRPALSCVTRVIQVKSLPPGWHVGYGARQWVRTPMTTATISMGIVDGMMSSQVNRGCVLVNGRRCRLLAACADTAIIDVSDAGGVEPGDNVVYIGSQGSERITAREQAIAAGTGFNELLSKISLRTPRVYCRKGKYAGEMSLGRMDGIAALN
ncbi:MAG: alanine racemase [Firmicutes bacterium]|nr:alanine racemase [Bacillota bacterium]